MCQFRLEQWFSTCATLGGWERGELCSSVPDLFHTSSCEQTVKFPGIL